MLNFPPALRDLTGPLWNLLQPQWRLEVAEIKEGRTVRKGALSLLPLHRHVKSGVMQESMEISDGSMVHLNP
jgi:hypothetical protein